MHDAMSVTNSSESAGNEFASNPGCSDNHQVVLAGGKRSPVRGDGISPDAKRINRRPSGSTGNVTKCRKRLQIDKHKENKEINLKLNALNELRKSRKVKPPVSGATGTVCDKTDSDEALCDILTELTNDVKIHEDKEHSEMDIQQFQTQYLPAHKKPKYHTREGNVRSSEMLNSVESTDEVDSGQLLCDIIDELTQSASSVKAKKPIKSKGKLPVGPEICESQTDKSSCEGKESIKDEELYGLEEDFKSLSPFK